MSGYLIPEFINFIQENQLIHAGDSILIAVSGGKDSTVLTDLLSKIQKSYNLHLGIAHLNHLLRGNESEGDAQHCRDMASKFNISFHYCEVDVRSFAKRRKHSIEQAARSLRYQFLQETAAQNGYNKIATAHTKNDQAETVLMHFLKGGRWESLQGIPLSKNNIIRPLLWCSSETIIHYLKKHNLDWREDSSNQNMAYMRNRVRHELIPLLQKKYNSQIIDALNRLGEDIGGIRQLIDSISHDNYEKILVDRNTERLILDGHLLRTFPIPVQKQILRKALSFLFPESVPLSSVLEISILEGLKRMQTGRRLVFEKDKEILFDRGNLIIGKVNIENFSYPVQLNQKYSWDKDNLQFASQILNDDNSLGEWDEVVDYEVFEAKQVMLRSWHEGDSFIPFGQKTKCKLSDFFVNHKIPRHNKRRIPILTAGDEIIWICGFRLSESARVTSGTRQRIGLRCRYVL